MKKTIATITQILIFIGAYFVMTPDTLEDNTHLFGLFGDVEVIKGNTVWVLLGAAFLSIINLWVWWPKSPTHKTVGDNAEAKAEDPVIPKMD